MMLTAAALAAQLAVATPVPPPPLTPAAEALVRDATDRLLAGESLPPGYLLQLQDLPPDQRLLILVHLRRSGMLRDMPQPAEQLLAPATAARP